MVDATRRIRALGRDAHALRHLPAAERGPLVQSLVDLHLGTTAPDDTPPEPIDPPAGMPASDWPEDIAAALQEMGFEDRAIDALLAPAEDVTGDAPDGERPDAMLARLRKLGIEGLLSDADFELGRVTERELPSAAELVDAMLAPSLRSGEKRLVQMRRARSFAEDEARRTAAEVAQARRVLQEAERRDAMATRLRDRARQVEEYAAMYRNTTARDRAEMLPHIQKALDGTHLRWRYRDGRIVDDQGRPLLPASQRWRT